MQSEIAAQLMDTLEQWHPPLEGDDVNPVLTFARRWLQKAHGEGVSLGTTGDAQWGRGIVTVVKQGDEPVAMVMWSHPKRRATSRSPLELRRTIAKLHHRHGKAALLFFLKNARQEGYTQAMVEGSQCTKTLAPFYQSCGFGMVGAASDPE